jgi:hypothetical protein
MAASAARAQSALDAFRRRPSAPLLNINDRGGLGELALEPDVLTAQLGDLDGERIGRLGRRPWPLIVQAGCPTRLALTPLRELGGVQAVVAPRRGSPRG